VTKKWSMRCVQLSLRSTNGAIDWRTLLRPPSGARFGELDGAWPYLPPTQMALVGLCTAREHLHVIRRLIGYTIP